MTEKIKLFLPHRKEGEKKKTIDKHQQNNHWLALDNLRSCLYNVFLNQLLTDVIAMETKPSIRNQTNLVTLRIRLVRRQPFHMIFPFQLTGTI